MQIIYKNINELQPYKKNPRKNDNAVKYVANSIKEFGFRVPVIIDNKGEIVAGHTRIKAARSLGIDKIPCVIADDLTPEQIKAFRLADNKTAEIAEWDEDLLGAELEGILNIDMGMFGFDLSVEPEAIEDNFDVDSAIPDDPITNPGDIYELGKHRLMCGSATNTGDVMLLMNGKLANLILTDPPYNVDYSGKTKDALKIANDKMRSEEFRKFLEDAFTNAYRSSKNGASAYIFHADSEGYNFRGAFCDAGFKLAQTCIWIKNTMVLGRQDYQWQHEPVLCGEKEEDEWQPVIYGWNPDGKHNWHSNRRQKTVWYFDKPNRSAEHPTMKPIPLMGYPIKNSSDINDVVLDLFGGSGSVLIACEQLQRICYMMEIDPRYCDVIVKRWEALTGCSAIRTKGCDTIGQAT